MTEVFIYQWFNDGGNEIRGYGVTRDGRTACAVVRGFRPCFYAEGKTVSRLAKNQTVLRARHLYADRGRDPVVFTRLAFDNRFDLRKSRDQFEACGVACHGSDASTVLQFVCVHDLPTAGWVKVLTRADLLGERLRFVGRLDRASNRPPDDGVSREDSKSAGCHGNRSFTGCHGNRKSPNLDKVSNSTGCQVDEKALCDSGKSPNVHESDESAGYYGNEKSDRCHGNGKSPNVREDSNSTGCHGNRESPNFHEGDKSVDRRGDREEKEQEQEQEKDYYEGEPPEDPVTVCDLELRAAEVRALPGDRAPASLRIMALDLEVYSEGENSMPRNRFGDKIFQIGTVVREPCGKLTRRLLALRGLDYGPEVEQYEGEAELLVGFVRLLKEVRPQALTGYNVLGFDLDYLLKRCAEHGLTELLKGAGMHAFRPARERKISWSSSAYARQEYSYLELEGILVLDLLPIVKRDYKLSNYRLETVATEFLGEGKDPVTFKDIFRACRTGVAAEVGRYCVKDAELCLKLIDRLDVWTGLTEMARVCRVDLMTLFTQGQQIRIYSQIYKYCRDSGTVVTDPKSYERVARAHSAGGGGNEPFSLRGKEKEDGGKFAEGIEDEEEAEEDGYAGAYVMDPEPGLYRNVVPLDFSSLYPSIMIAKNICYSTSARPGDPGSETFEWEDHVNCPHSDKVREKAELTLSLEKTDLRLKSLKAETAALLREAKAFRGKEAKALRRAAAAAVGSRGKASGKIKESSKERDEAGEGKESRPTKGEEEKEEAREAARKALEAENRAEALAEERRALEEKSKRLRARRAEISVAGRKVCGTRRYAFFSADSERGPGVVPSIVRNLLESRSAAKKLKAKAVERGDSALAAVYDKRQLAYKVSANSMYGAMGVRKGYLPFSPGAMCITYYGRLCIEKAAALVERDHGGRLVYGDTDSNYVVFPGLEDAPCAELWDRAEKTAERVSAAFPPPLRLEFEKVIYSRFLILSKKRYMYVSKDRDGRGDGKIGYRGVLLARRDNAPAVRRIYERVAEALLLGDGGAESALAALCAQTESIFSGELDPADFSVTKQVGDWRPGCGDYKVRDPETAEKAAAARLADVLAERERAKAKADRDGGGEVSPPVDFADESALKESLLMEEISKQMPPHVRLADKLRRRGMPVGQGSRLEHVVLRGREAGLGDRLESLEYYTRWKRFLELDRLHYVKAAVNPVDQLLETALGLKDRAAAVYRDRLAKAKMLEELTSLKTLPY